MPDLDVSDVLLDPMFCEALTITRRAVTLVKGRSVVTPTTISPTPYGVVLPIPDQPMQRGPDQQTLPKLLGVHTTFRLRGPSPGFQPDVITWNGDAFVVNRVYDAGHFGAGFIYAECSSMDLIDQPPA